VIKKQLTLFDHISNLTSNKVSWEKLSIEDRKSYSPFMVLRILSMDPDLLEACAELDQHIISNMSARDSYKLLFDILPKRKFYLKYIKGKKEMKYHPELVNLIVKYFQISTGEAVEYLNIYTEPDNLSDLKLILKKYGNDDKNIKRLLMQK